MREHDGALHCSGCEQVLAEHCETQDCMWLVCSHRDCDHQVYDLDRGALLMRDGTVEVLGL